MHSLAKNWYTSFTELVHADYRSGTHRLPKWYTVVTENWYTVGYRLQTGVIIIPVFPSLDIYAKEKATLRKAGQPVDDFDLLIGATAISNGLTLVTNNVDHLGRMEGIKIEDWTK
jgi:tRNA(fMet)-specific endonuclease VapC